MRHLILIPLFLLLYLPSNAQNYYVAVVRGQVFYKGKVLKKRDKVKLGGEIQFTSKEDYLKLSGPGGLYTLTPDLDEDDNNEFLVALRNELFPQVRILSPSAYVNEYCFNCYFLLSPDDRFTFHKRHQFQRTIPDLKEGEELGFIHQTNFGLIYRTAELADSFLIIKEEDFILNKMNNLVPEIQKTFIVHVFDKPAFLETLESYSNLEDLKAVFVSYNVHSGIGNSPDEETNQALTYQAMILDSMGPTGFVSKKALYKDLKHHVKLSNPSNLNVFLYEFEYEAYINETYGNTHFLDIENIWKRLRLEHPAGTNPPDPIN